MIFTPAILITVFFSAGVVSGRLISSPYWMTGIVLACFSVMLIYSLFRRLSFNLLFLIVFFLFGMFYFQFRNLPNPKDISNYPNNKYVSITGMVDDLPKVRETGINFPLKVRKISFDRETYLAEGTIYVSLQKNNPHLEYGSQILVRGILSPLQNYSNPLMLPARKAFSITATACDVLPGNQGNFFRKLALFLSQQFNLVLNKILPQKEASLLGSILLGGSVSPLSQETKDIYRKAGLIHLLVVSGSQVSILIGACMSICRLGGLPEGIGIFLTSFFNFMLVIISGAGSSILRAAIMGEIALLGMLTNRRKEFYTALAVSALVLLMIDPECLFDIGFQLSFAATWALVYIAPVLEKKLPVLLATTLAPILATMPLIIYYFSQISLGALFSNILVLPWVEFLVLLGFSSTLLGFIFLPLAMILGNTLWLMLTLLDWITNLVASIPGLCFYIQPPSVLLVITYYLALITAIELFKREGKIIFSGKRLVFAALFLFSILVWDKAFSADHFGGRELMVTFLDVGQGDCSLIELPDGKKVLIDGGGVDRGEGESGMEKQAPKDAVGEKVVVPFLHRRGINHLDLMIMTHPHADHLGGLISVLEAIKVDQVFDNGQTYASAAYRRFKELVETNRINYGVPVAGQIVNFAEDIKGYIINPSFPLLGDTNSDSIVMRLVFGKIAFLFTGDLGEPGEERVLQLPGLDLSSMVLKVGHHGSRTSTTDEFLKKVNPLYAVISVGRHNRYRHPAVSTLEKLSTFGTKIFRTDLNGAVTFRTDGEKLAIDLQK